MTCPLPQQTRGVERLVRVEAPHFVAGIVFQRRKAVETAPILRWALGSGWSWFSRYCERNGWKLLVLDPLSKQWREPLK